MKAVGIVVEYNPLHFGHLHHIQEAKKKTDADIMIAVMSGNVVQRGNFSIVDKFEKTKWALRSGIDLVIELPSVFVLQSADVFALTSVSLLNHLRISQLVFGSETGIVEPLKDIAKIMRDDDYNARVKYYMNQGYSYPNSCDLALKEYNQSNTHAHPNNILGIQYIQAINDLNATIEPFAIKRIQSDYHDDLKPNQVIQSATAIRACIAQNKAYKHFVPNPVYETLKDYPCVDIEHYHDTIQALIATHSQKTLERIFSFDEGFENRVLKTEKTDSVKALVEQLKTPRYTHAKIYRSIMHMLLNIEKDLMTSKEVPYIRVLGMNSVGQNYLSSIKKDLTIPLITKIKNDRHAYLNKELNISKLYDLCTNRNLFLREFEPVIIF